MGLTINTNIASLLVQRSLQQNTTRLNSVLQELSTGERINRAGDDASGLAVSQTLRIQSRGLEQALRNIDDGRSVLETAESALAGSQDILQRLRELSVQAANGSNSTNDRVAIQEEIDSLLDELGRIAETTQFNRKPLLDGSFLNQRLQIGYGADAFLPVSIRDVRPSALGQQAVVTGMSPVSLTPIAGGGDLVINGVQIPASTADGVSFIAPDASAIAKVNAINRVAAQTGVTATVDDSVFQVAGAGIGSVALDGTSSALFINGINIGAVTVNADDATGALRDAINSHTEDTGVEATLGAGGELVLSARDGRTFQVTTIGSVADDLGLATADGDLTAQTVTGGVTLTSAADITVGGTDTALIGYSGADLLTVVDPNSALDQISVTTADSAEEAIGLIDAAIEQLNRTRADLGAISNHLEASTSRLLATVENLKASDARIRDTDFAEATARATQEQIIQQAATAILAQANNLPTSALSLLQQ